MGQIVRSYIRQSLFSAAPPHTLSLCRVVIYGFACLCYAGHDFGFFSELSRDLWRPIAAFGWMRPGALAPETITLMKWLWIGSLLLSCVGLFTSASTKASLLLGAPLLGFENSVGKPHHMECLLLLSLLWLAFSHCADAWSVDALLCRREAIDLPARIESRRLQGHYSWPVWFVRIQMTLIFCAAGASKLRNSGLCWVLSDNLYNILAESRFIPKRSEPLWPALAVWICESRLLCQIIAGTSLLLEVAAPIAIVCAPLRHPIVGGLLCMMASFWVLMGTSFPQMLVCWVFWLPFIEIRSSPRGSLENRRTPPLGVQLSFRSADPPAFPPA